MWGKIKKRLDILGKISRPLDVILMLRIFAFYIFINPILLKVNLSRLKTFLEPQFSPTLPDQAKTGRTIEYIDAIVKVGKPLIPSRCFTRGTMMFYFLRRAGLRVDLVFGVEKTSDAFTGHCWLLKDEAPYLEANDPRKFYTPMYTIIGGTVKGE
jgi:hypothetical protein